jgi:hypothetical protein
MLFAPMLIAQELPVQFTPPFPTRLDQIRAEFLISSCDVANEVQTFRSGNLVRSNVLMPPCQGGPVFTYNETALLGPLPAGAYTYEVYVLLPGEPEQFLYSVPLVVADAPEVNVPALSPGALAAMLALLAMAGVFMSSRH